MGLANLFGHLLTFTILYCGGVSMNMDVEMFQGDSQELIFDYIVETCSENEPSFVDKSFSNVRRILRNMTSGKEVFDDFCWEGVTIEYDVVNINCINKLSPTDLSKVNAVFMNGYSDGIVAVLSSCKSATKFEQIVASNWSSRASRIIMVLPEKCESNMLTSSTSMEPLASTYINRIVANREILQSTIFTSVKESREQFITIIYDDQNEFSKVEGIVIAKRLYDMGVELQLLHYDKFITMDDYFTNWVLPVSSATIFIMCKQSNVISILNTAMEHKVMNLTKLSWIIYEPENIWEVQETVADVIRYDMRLLIIKNSKVKNSMNMTMLSLQILQKRFGTYGMNSQQCIPCEEDEIVLSRSQRIVYSPIPGINSRLECAALWDLSMTMKSSRKENSVWGPLYPRMLGIKLTLSVIDSPPFIIKNDKDTVNGTKYKGFFVDVIDTIVSSLQFSYDFVEPRVKSYGLLVNGSFNGIIGQVERKKADVGVAQIAYLVERTKVVDYLNSYTGYKGVKLVYKNPDVDKLNWNTDWITSFTDPFQTSVWMFVVLTVVAAAVSMTTCESFQDTNKYLKYNPRITEFKNPFNNLFYMYSALLNQGWDMTPEAISSRVVVICFRFFCVFMYAGYSAVIVSQNVVSRDVAPFNSLEDILTQGNYKLGVLKNTNFERILKTADQGLYKKTWEYIMKQPNNLVSTAKEGLNKVKEERYVFIHDEDEADYETTTSCTYKAPDDTPLQGINTFVVQKNSPYSAALSSQLTAMHETGVIQRLRMKWWKPQKSDACDYLRAGQGGAATQKGVTLGTLRMPFVLMLAGIGISFVFLCVEYQTKRFCPSLLDISS